MNKLSRCTRNGLYILFDLVFLGAGINIMAFADPNDKVSSHHLGQAGYLKWFVASVRQD